MLNYSRMLGILFDEYAGMIARREYHKGMIMPAHAIYRVRAINKFWKPVIASILTIINLYKGGVPRRGRQKRGWSTPGNGIIPDIAFEMR
jgi:hypothetical protein